LKTKVKQFIINNPSKAFHGFYWRLKKYTIDQDVWYSIYLFHFWWTLSILFLIKSNIPLLFRLIIIGVPLYITLVISVFPYVGIRYLLTPNLYYFCSALLIMSYLDELKLITYKLKN